MSAKTIMTIISAAAAIVFSSCDSAGNIAETAAKLTGMTAPDTEQTETTEENEMSEKVIYITVNGTTLTADLAGNSSAEAFAELLSKGDLTIEMSDYGSFEKVGDIGTKLPRNDEQITTEPGDIILYQGSSVTIYYDTNSWSFTRLGKLRDISADELRRLLGKGSITATFSLKG